jgi:polyhydroxyalkanoate synthesis regulator phasin
MNRQILTTAALVCSIAMSSGIVHAAQSPEGQSLTELRNTVINLLQGLVDRGVLTREQAELMVRDAQTKAAAEAAVLAAQDKAEENAVRVPYVPQIVKDEIRMQVAAELGADVTKAVVESAQNDGWGVPAALPDWVRRMNWSGDMRVRAQGDMFAADNTPNNYLDYQRINEAGGIGAAGIGAFVNTTEDRERLRMRLRFGFDVTLGYGWTMGTRIASGSLRDPISTNQTLGSYEFRYQPGIDLAYVDWQGQSRSGRQSLQWTGGRMRSPWFTPSELVFDQDLNFDGVATTWRFGLDQRDPTGRSLFFTGGAFPLQEVELSSRDKWLFAGQLGLNWKASDSIRLKAGVGYYNFRNIAGERNAFQSKLLDHTAPQFVRQGNSLFDIRNDSDPSTQLYALASDFELVNASMSLEWRLANPEYRVTLTGDIVRNIGFDAGQILNRTGLAVAERNEGYLAEVGFGSTTMARTHAWRVALGYRYVQRDAVIDAFTDSDFRLGGTDVEGYTFTLEHALTPKVVSRLRYLSGSEIDGPPLGIDVVQLDLTASF